MASRFVLEFRHEVRNKRNCFQDMIEAAYLLKTHYDWYGHPNFQNTLWLKSVYPASVIEEMKNERGIDYKRITPKFEENEE